MVILIAILVSLGLFVGFVILTLIEKKRGVRAFENARAVVDAQVARASFIVGNTDFSDAFLRFARMITAHIAHDVTAMTLRGVRLLERLLATMHVRLRRARRAEAPTGSRFVKSISYFKRTLRNPQESPEGATTENTVG